MSPLAPPPTESPQATLLGFLGAMRAAHDAALGPDAGERSMTALRRAARTLDLSGFRDILAEKRGVEAALKLKEVIDRIEMPALAEAPDLRDVRRADAADGVAGALAALAQGADPGPVEIPDGPIDAWTIPGTEIAIVRIETGPRRGAFLFSADTVMRADEFYARVRKLPYAEAGPPYMSLNRTPGIYQTYITTPGEGLSPGWGRHVPRWAGAVYFGQTLWQWLALAGVLAATGALAFAAIRWAMAPERAARAAMTDAVRVRERLRLLLALGLAVAATYSAERLVDDVINVTGDVLIVVYDALVLSRYALFAWLVAILIMQIADLAAAARGLEEKSPDRHLIGFVARLAALVAITVVVILVAQRLGLPVYSVVTGLGIGGLAVAFAAQQSLGAVFGSIMIIMDRPFRVGDHLHIDGREGVVEDIGFRSTRIRTYTGSVVTVPNSEMASAVVDNLGLRGQRHVCAAFEIREDTPPETIRAFLGRLRAILAESPAIEDEDADVALIGFGSGGLRVGLECFVDAEDRSARRREVEELHMRILAAAEALGVEFAPSQALDVALAGPAAAPTAPAGRGPSRGAERRAPLPADQPAGGG